MAVKKKSEMKKSILEESVADQIRVMAQANESLQDAYDAIQGYSRGIGFARRIFPMMDDIAGHIKQAQALLEQAVNGLDDVNAIPQEYWASAKKSKVKKYVAHTANYGEAHMNPDYTISYGQNDFEIPDYLEFNVDGQYVRADVEDDSSRGHARWFVEVPFADSTMWINCWSWGYKTLEYNIDYRGRAGVPDYEGKTTFDNLAPIQQAIDHIVNDVKLRTSVAPSDNVYGGTQVYVDGAFVPWEERFNDKTWSAKKSISKANSGEKFKRVITNWINEQNEKYKRLSAEIGFPDENPRFDMYSFHDYDDRVEFSFDGPLYEALNNSDGYGWDIRDSLAQRLKDEGLEWNADYGSVWSHYFASTKKSIPNTKMSFTDNVNKMRVNNYAKTGNINTVMKKRD